MDEMMKKTKTGMPKKEMPQPKGHDKIEKVMAEFKAGTLRSSSGALVTDMAQARAIAMSEQREYDKKS